MCAANGGKVGSVDISSRNPFEYLATCHIGHHVEVHLKDRSVNSGVFHAADVENNFGIVLKIACLIREGSLRGMTPLLRFSASHLQRYSFSLPTKTFLLIMLIWKESLKRRVPDEDVPDCSDLENVFDDPWKRGWNQFEVNKTFFGVTSTFDEELYTTKLEGGPRTRELEEKASRIAREIEGENTRDLHVAKERGLQLSGKFNIDEETKYSSVCPVNGFDDSGYEEEDEEEILLNCRNNLTFRDSTSSDGMKSASAGNVKGFEESWVRLGSSRGGGSLSSVGQSCSNSNKHAREPMFEQLSKDIPAPGSNMRSGLEDINEDAATSDPWRSSDTQNSTDGKLLSQLSDSVKSESSCWRPGSSISRNPENSATSSPSSRPILSPSSSIGSYSSEKSTLNPNAKEFKPNPNAKSFKPSPTATRPRSPVPEGSFYYPPVPPMPRIHIVYGVTSFTLLSTCYL
ncbi:hypothetical protein Bca4012_063653 [Brassica carinata]